MIGEGFLRAICLATLAGTYALSPPKKSNCKQRFDALCTSSAPGVSSNEVRNESLSASDGLNWVIVFKAFPSCLVFFVEP